MDYTKIRKPAKLSELEFKKEESYLVMDSPVPLTEPDADDGVLSKLDAFFASSVTRQFMKRTDTKSYFSKSYKAQHEAKE